MAGIGNRNIPELLAKRLDNLRPALKAFRSDVRTDVSVVPLRRACAQLSPIKPGQRSNRLRRDARNGSTPSCMSHRKTARRRNNNDRYAVREAEHCGHIGNLYSQVIGALGSLSRRAGK